MKAALIVVDFQEDFCPPGGSLAIAGGREIANAINRLMEMSFCIKIATQDWHPQNHVSFASNHPAPHNKPFESLITVTNPMNARESETVRLWPDHCVQETFGASFVSEFSMDGIDLIVKKGQDPRVEMFSAFRDTFANPCVSESGLSGALKQAGVSYVFIAGLARDVCVKYTALHAKEDGYGTFVVSDATASAAQTLDAQQTFEKDMAFSDISLVTMSEVECLMNPSSDFI